MVVLPIMNHYDRFCGERKIEVIFNRLKYITGE